MYSNITESMVILCKRSKSLKYPNKYTCNYGLWTAEPTTWSFVVYGVLIPIVSVFGIVGNSLILAVHFKKNFKKKSSTYTYLVAFAASDIVTCILLLFSGLARGIFRCQRGWLEFDAFVHFPIGSVTSNITVWAALGVCIDRLITVCSMSKYKSSKFCNQRFARRIMIFATCLAILINIPYCFMYTYNHRGDLVTTKFFHTRFYNFQNWLQFVIFGLVPAIFLFFANSIMCYYVKKALKQRQILLKHRNIREGNRLWKQTRLTIMLVGIVFSFIVGELPTHLVSRRSAISLLYGGDITKVHEILLDRFRMWVTFLNAISSSVNFILYCLLSPCFLVQLKRLIHPEATVAKKKCGRKGVAYFQQRSGCKTKCEIFIV